MVVGAIVFHLLCCSLKGLLVHFNFWSPSLLVSIAAWLRVIKTSFLFIFNQYYDRGGFSLSVTLKKVMLPPPMTSALNMFKNDVVLVAFAYNLETFARFQVSAS